jgi:hypothetical protein
MNLGVLAVLGVCVGCASAVDSGVTLDDEEQVGVQALPIGEVACRFATANSERRGGNSTVTINAPYDNPMCRKAYVVDYKGVTVAGRYLYLKYTGAPVLNEEVCSFMLMRMDIYRYDNLIQDYVLKRTASGRGTWRDNKCIMPLLQKDFGGSNGDYRVTVQTIRSVSTQETFPMTLTNFKLTLP